jgi:DeoR/GlpR family transcriptional regulator of sugar metabolism
MLKAERQLKILNEIKESQKVDTNKLSLQLIVSKDTIRRDLNELSKKGKIQKVHGGALHTSENNAALYDTYIADEEKKYIIAVKASTLLKDSQVVIISGGTTNLVFAKSIPKDLSLTVYTYSLPIAMQLSQHPKIDLIFIGGKMQKNALVTIGLDVIQFLSNIKADLCFLGTSSINEEFGLTEAGYEVSIVKKAMIQSSSKVIAMVTSEKINTKMPHAVCDLQNIYAMITDLKAKDSKLEPYTKAGILVI